MQSHGRFVTSPSEIKPMAVPHTHRLPPTSNHYPDESPFLCSLLYFLDSSMRAFFFFCTCQCFTSPQQLI